MQPFFPTCKPLSHIGSYVALHRKTRSFFRSVGVLLSAPTLRTSRPAKSTDGESTDLGDESCETCVRSRPDRLCLSKRKESRKVLFVACFVCMCFFFLEVCECSCGWRASWSRVLFQTLLLHTLVVLMNCIGLLWRDAMLHNAAYLDAQIQQSPSHLFEASSTR